MEIEHNQLISAADQAFNKAIADGWVNNLSESVAFKVGFIYGFELIQKENPQWINVNDRYPLTSANDDLIKVLGWDGIQVLRVDYYKYQDETSGRFRISCLKCFNEVTETITHWMELPKPPNI